MLESTLEEIRPIFHDVFGNSSNAISLDSKASEVEGWDSFTHIAIVMAIEERFQVMFSTEDLGRITCVRDLCIALDELRGK